MHRIVALISICCLTFPGIYNLVNFVDYSVNTEKYLESCENLEEPETQCNGLCQLVDELVQHENSDEETRATLTISDIPFFLVPVDVTTISQISENSNASAFRSDLADDYLPSCFRPPCA